MKTRMEQVKQSTSLPTQSGKTTAVEKLGKATRLCAVLILRPVKLPLLALSDQDFLPLFISHIPVCKEVKRWKWMRNPVPVRKPILISRRYTSYSTLSESHADRFVTRKYSPHFHNQSVNRRESANNVFLLSGKWMGYITRLKAHHHLFWMENRGLLSSSRIF